MPIAQRGIVLAEFGERGREIRGFIKNIRTVSNLPIIIYSDRSYENLGDGVFIRVLSEEKRYWRAHQRYYNRNNDYWKLEGAMIETDFDTVLIMDDDMRIVNSQFVQGFELAERFGLCLPINPRTYFGLDREVGDDVPDDVIHDTKDCPYYMTANNMGVIFLDTTDGKVRSVVNHYLTYMQHHPCRGPVAMAVACWRERFSPYILPEEWCACGGYTSFRHRSNKRIQPMFLHIGHPDVAKWFEADPAFADYRG